VAELSAQFGALLAVVAVLVVPGTSGHAAQTSPRGLTLLFDWVHLAAGSVWLGGLVGLLVVWFSLGSRARVPALSVAVPRFSAVAVGSVLALGLSGLGEALDHLPAFDALWLTGYGRAILVKIGLMVLALGIASGNLLRSRPRMIAAADRPELGDPAVRLLRGLVSAEVVVVVGVVFAAAVLSSLAPPPPAFALQNAALAKVGPGTVARAVNRAGYDLELLVSPNRAVARDSFELRITKGGQPVRDANVTLSFEMTTMQMPQQEYQLTEVRPGVYARAAPALVMVGEWGLTFQVAPKSGPPFSALILDQANG
jgi:copper transport protein